MANYMDDLFVKVKGKGGNQTSKPENNTPPVPEKKEPKDEPKQRAQAAAQKIDTPDIKPEQKAPAKEETMQDKIPVAKTDEEMEEAEEQSEIQKRLEQAQKELIDSTGSAKIYKIPGQELLYYWAPVSRPLGTERAIINTIKEAATRIITISPYKIRDPEERRHVYFQKISEILRESPELRIPANKIEFYAGAVVREMVGYGLIDTLIKDENLEEIMVIGPKTPIYVFHRKYGMMLSNIEFFSDNEIQDLINRIARLIGRRVDLSSPLLDARLPDGSRVNATMPPASVDGSTLTIRKFRADPYSIVDLVRFGTLNLEVAAFLWLAVEGLKVKPANMLISGGTGSGKTTTLNVLASFIPDSERIISIEDTAELKLPLTHWVRMEARPPGLEGTGEITLDILTKNSLRMRPDRIIVGEIRHAEAFALFTAMNTGHEGALSADTLVQFSDGNIKKIGKIAEEQFALKLPVTEKDYEFADISETIEVPSFNKQTLKIESKKIKRVWRKKYNGKLKKIRLKSGKELLLTSDHPLYGICNGINEINARNLSAGDFISIPLQIPVEGKGTIADPHFLGMLYGDGHISHEHTEFGNKSSRLVALYRDAIGKYTNNTLVQKIEDDYERIKLYDTKLVNRIAQEFDIPQGNKTKVFKIEEKILTAGNETLGKLLKGLFDCEAHVNLHANGIEFSTSNPDLALKLPLMLQRFGVGSTTYTQPTDGRGHKGPYYKISIYGRENLCIFRDRISFEHPEKRAALDKLITKSKNSIDIFPNMERTIKDMRGETGLTQAELGMMLGAKTRSTINAYETGARAPSRTMLNRICKIVNTKTSGQLKIMAESDLRFEQIVSVTEEQYDGFVYDFTVEDNHTYIANGIIVSNCLGTVHANSPQETLVRVTSPPMNVPEVMLAGLNFVIVQHRLHDKKMGTIRRVTEIAEVSGALEGKPKTETIFRRDAATDSLIRTKAPIQYLKMLEERTGMTQSQILAETEKRKEFLEKLVEDRRTDQKVISEQTREFILAEK